MKKLFINALYQEKTINFLCEDGKIVEIFNEQPAINNDCEVIDLANHSILPGFFPFGTNVFNYSQYYLFCDLNGINTTKVVWQQIEKYINLMGNDKIIFAIGLKDELSNIFDEHNNSITTPIIIYTDKQNIIINDALIEWFKKKNININTKNHVVEQKDIDLVLNNLAPKSIDDINRAFLVAQKEIIKSGATTIQTIIHEPEHLNVLVQLSNQQKLLIDYVIFLDYEKFKDIFPKIKDVFRSYHNHLRIAGLWFKIDGELYDQEAMLSENEQLDSNQLDSIHKAIDILFKIDTKILIEANGDYALEILINKIMSNIEYLNHVKSNLLVKNNVFRPNQLMNIHLLNFSIINDPDLIWNYGSNFIKNSFLNGNLICDKTLIEKNINVISNHDYLAYGNNLFETIWTLTNRKTRELKIINQNQTLDISSALDTLIINPLNKMDETLKGMIAKGFYADFIVLDKNPYKTETSYLSSIKVIKVFKQANEIYSK